MCVCLCVPMWVSMSVCVYVGVYVRVCVYECVCVCVSREQYAWYMCVAGQVCMCLCGGLCVCMCKCSSVWGASVYVGFRYSCGCLYVYAGEEPCLATYSCVLMYGYVRCCVVCACACGTGCR